jgi:hypothetical protein
MVIVGFIVINQFVVWFLRVDYLYQVILPILLSRRHFYAKVSRYYRKKST